MLNRRGERYDVDTRGVNSLSSLDVTCNRSRVFGLVPDVCEFWTMVVERKVTNGVSENNAQHFRIVTRAVFSRQV